MPAKPFRTKRKRASAERYLRPLGATIDIAPPHVKASNGFRERDSVAWRFTKRQAGYQGEYWVLSLSGNCCWLINRATTLGDTSIVDQDIEAVMSLHGVQHDFVPFVRIADVEL